MFRKILRSTVGNQRFVERRQVEVSFLEKDCAGVVNGFVNFVSTDAFRMEFGMEKEIGVFFF